MSEIRVSDSREHLLDAYNLNNVVRDPDFGSITAFASSLCDTPISLITIVDDERQNFLSCVGLDIDGTPRESSFCAHAMNEPGIMTIPDAAQDPRFARNPLVLGPPYIRFYAGAPLVSEEGLPLGSLCVIDSSPRAGLTSLQKQGLRVLADQVMVVLRSRRTDKARQTIDSVVEQTLTESDQKFRVLADAMPQMVWSTLPDGFHDYYNARWYEYTGMPVGSTDGEGWNGMFHVDDQDRAWATWRHSLATGDPYEIEYRLRNAAGDYRWTLGRALAMRGPDGDIVRWFGTCTDIHEHKLMLEQREMISQELSHRIKNIFSVIGGLISLSSRANPQLKPLANELRERVMALGRAHDFVRPHSYRSQRATDVSSLQGMLGELLSAYQSDRDDRIVISGDNPTIDDRSATPLALLFHELATNAAKYGALSTAEGRIMISIAQHAETVVIEWAEEGGPAIHDRPVQSGFGSTLIEMSAERQLGGSLDRAWRKGGLQVTLRIPASAMSRPHN